MAYLFQSGTLDVQLSGGMNLNYSLLETSKNIAINSDAANTTATAGLLEFGNDGGNSDGAIYWDGSQLCVGTGGSLRASFDANGLDLESGDDYSIADASVLNATTLGGLVVNSSLEGVGTLVAGQFGTDAVPLTAYINAGELDGTVIGGETAAAATVTTLKATSYSGSTTLSAGGNIMIGDDADILPETDNNSNLGTSAKQFKDLYVNGIGYIDQLGASGDPTTAYVAAVSGSSTLSTAGNIMIGDDADILPETDNNSNLGTSAKQFKDLYVNGIGYIDQLGTDLDAVTAYINAGELDGTVIGGESAVAGTFTTLTATALVMPTVTSGYMLVADGSDYEEVAMSGDATLASGGALAIGATKVTDAMINDDVASTLAGAGMTAASGVMAVVNATNGGLSVAPDDISLDFSDLSVVTAIASGDTFGMSQEDETDDPTKKITIDSIATKLAGSGITATAGVLSVSADSSTIQGIGDAAGALTEGMNYGTTEFTASRIWTVPVINGNFAAGDICRIKAPGLAGNTLTVAINAADQVDDLKTGVDLELQSDNASITLQCVVSAVAGKWRII